MWRWILLAAAALLVLVCLTRVGVEAAFGGVLRLDIRLGPLRFGILPAKKKAKKAEKKPKKAPPKKAKKKKAAQTEAKKLPAITFEDIKDALHTLFPVLKRLLRRIGRGIRIHPFRLSLTLGGRMDAAGAAETYGKVQTAVWLGMPQLERLLDIPEPSVHTEVDFDAPGTVLEGEVGATFRIGTLLALGFGVLVPALGWLLRFWKRSRRRIRAETEKTEQAENPREGQAA